jgi:malate dehydrogenase (oxaloacetate-decarboxylating)
MNSFDKRALYDDRVVPYFGGPSGILENPLLNRGTAFTIEERDAFQLHGLLPDHVETLANQVTRQLECARALPCDLDRYVFLRELQDTNETLFYALLVNHLDELLPIIYTPTVGLGCQRFSRIYRRPRGLFLSILLKDKLDQIFANPRFDDVECIVVTDGERILGLGDQGVGGMGIPIGKLSIYSACGGVDPAKTLPITLDVGTDNLERLGDPLYFGWRHERVRGEAYDDFIEAFVSAVIRRWPDVLLQWEDFHKNNANRLLERYRDRLCTFNDDIQGTAAVATAALLSAVAVTGLPLTEQRIAVFGGGSAGIGIADLVCSAMAEAGLDPAEAARRFYIVGRHGLVTDETPNLDAFQLGYRQPSAQLAEWRLDAPGKAALLDVVRNVRPTVLIGVAGQQGAFTEAVVRELAAHVERPVVFPLSNPTSCAEAKPEDIVRWTDGRAIIGTGSPFAPFTFEGKTHRFSQTNNSYIFPGVGLGVLAVKARRVTNRMFLAAARALAEFSLSRKTADERLLPEPSAMRAVSAHIAAAVAKQARDEGLTDSMSDAQIVRRVQEKIWAPEYRPIA